MVEMLAVGVCDEYLTEVVAAHQFDYLLHASRIQFVEDVVEQEQRCRVAARLAQEVKLCKLERGEVRLVLSLDRKSVV